jgi:hypothetical protein
MATIDIYGIWERYNKSKTYMDKKGLLVKTEKSWQMYSGKQWAAVEDSKGMENLPMLNFIKPTVDYKVSTIAQHSVTALFSDMNGGSEPVPIMQGEVNEMGIPIPTMVTIDEIIDKLNTLFGISWEKAKMNRTAWKNLKHSAIEADSYVYWGEGGDTRKAPQMLHNTQIHLGDENITNIQEQPWIIIEERLEPAYVRERARLAGISKKDIDLIQPDKEMDTTLLNKEEVKGKVTSLLYMEKDIRTGIVSVGRCTKNVMYQPVKPIQQSKGGELIDTGLTMYPIVPMIWLEMPNDARGVSEVEQLIPNQLELNKTLARRSISVKMTAFPRIAYDDSMIANPDDLEKVGAAIKINGGGAQSISNMITYLAPQAMSGDAKQLSDELLNESRTLAGASDAQLGNIDLSRVSGTAAQTIRDQQQVPLNEQVSMYQDFVENVALLWFELWKVYYPEGIEWDGIKLSAEEILSVEPNVRVDIAEDTSLSKMAAQQEITNLFMNNKITMAEFAEAYPDHSTLPKDVLKKIVQTRQTLQQQGIPLLNDDGTPINDMVGGGVNPGGMSGGSYQNLQSMLAQ